MRKNLTARRGALQAVGKSANDWVFVCVQGPSALYISGFHE
jgi:hypothetical protein